MSTKKPPARNKKKFLINRELSWLVFNDDVIEEAVSPRHPLLERLRYLAISASNLDEFYMVRVAGLLALAQNSTATSVVDDNHPRNQLEAIDQKARSLLNKQQRYLTTVLDELKKHAIEVHDATSLMKTEGEHVQKLTQRFEDMIFPVLTPMTLDPAHPFPFIPNRGVVLALSVRSRDKVDKDLLIPIPDSLPRFVSLTLGAKLVFVPIESMIEQFLTRLLPGATLQGGGLLRLLRDSDVEIEDDAEDLMRSFENLLKRRRRGSIIRLTMQPRIPSSLRATILSALDYAPEHVIDIAGFIGLDRVAEIVEAGPEKLKYKKHTSRFPERILEYNGNIFDAVRYKDILVHHPYESFDVVVKFVQQAADDAKVVSIKQTLYRTSKDSPIVRALVDAAESGKSVTALIELRARFDEEANIKWARDLERAGVQVCYGFMSLKTHCKISLIARKEDNHVRSYVHFGTGNYHPVTAKVYTDLSLFTADEALARDAARVFNYMTSSEPPGKLECIAVSPSDLHERLMTLIDNEIEHAKNGRKAAVWFKLNNLTEKNLIDRLCLASRHGVEIKGIVRGVCSLRPGVKNYSQGVHIQRIIGRFLEHARIICFGNGAALPNKDALVFLSSADWMPRNMFHRVEVLVPLQNQTVKKQALWNIMQTEFADTENSRMLRSDGHYCAIKSKGTPNSCHNYFLTNPSLSGRGQAGNPLEKKP